MKECRSSVYEPRRSKIGSSKEIVGKCKYNMINEKYECQKMHYNLDVHECTVLTKT